VTIRTLEAVKLLVEEMYQAKHRTPLVKIKADAGVVIGLEVELDTHFGTFMVGYLEHVILACLTYQAASSAKLHSRNGNGD